MREHARALLAKGVSRQDSATAVHLAWYIRALDMCAFPGESAVVECRPEGHPMGFVAGYDDEHHDPERYLVFANGIHRRFVASCRDFRFVRGYGPGTKFPSLPERLVAVAVHEARHRYQRRSGDRLRTWTPHTRASGLMGRILARAREERMSGILQAKVQGLRMLAGHLREFDALVVEYHALHHIHAVEGPEDLVPLVTLQP
jgi:hypothetical protein